MVALEILDCGQYLIALEGQNGSKRSPLTVVSNRAAVQIFFQRKRLLAREGLLRH
jgi:hypothetical protein